MTFFDGQNLYRSVKETFGCSHPNYDVLELSNAICEREGWLLSATPRFYTGVPRRTGRSKVARVLGEQAQDDQPARLHDLQGPSPLSY